MVTINGKNNTYYSALYIHKEIDEPTPKQNFVSVPLRDGSVDVTSFLTATPYFESRKITIGLEIKGLRNTWPNAVSKIYNEIHGKRVEVEFDEDSGWIWIGSAAVQTPEDHGASLGISIEVTAEPFKRRKTATVIANAASVSGDVQYTVTVSDPRGYLSFNTSTTGFTVTVGSQTWTLPQGDSTCFGLVLLYGSTTISVHGTGTITIKETGGSL